MLTARSGHSSVKAPTAVASPSPDIEIPHFEFIKKFRAFEAILKQKRLDRLFDKIIQPVLTAHERNAEVMDQTKAEIK